MPRTVTHEELMSAMDSPFAIQKVQELINAAAIVAPAPTLDPDLRERLLSTVADHDHVYWRLVPYELLENCKHSLDLMVAGHLEIVNAINQAGSIDELKKWIEEATGEEVSDQ